MTSSPNGNNAHLPIAAEMQLLRECLDDAVRAPSGRNTQPWQFRFSENYLDVLADRSRSLPVVDPDDRELTISCGALVGHMITAMRQRGRVPRIEKFPDKSQSNLIARIRPAERVDASMHERNLYNAIFHRRTNRASFTQRALPHDLLNHCQLLAAKLHVDLTLIDDITARTEIADLVAEGDRVQFADKRFRKELSSWVHSRRSGSNDGISGDAFGMPDSLSSVGGFAIKNFNTGKSVAADDWTKVVNGSSVLAIFSTGSDTGLDWLNTGICLSDVLLSLTAAKATASYLNQVVEVESLRTRLIETANAKGIPQLLLRFGYGPDTPASVRRPVDDCIIG